MSIIKKKLKKSSKKWVLRQVKDDYVKLSKKQGYRSRAAFKLIQMHEKYKIFKKGDKVLDLGSSPGSWLQVAKSFVYNKKYCINKTKLYNRLVGVDILNMQKIEGVTFLQKDCKDADLVDNIFSISGIENFDIMLSDMSPNTTGFKHVDHLSCINLSKIVFKLAKSNLLVNKGYLIMKLFQGVEVDDFLRQIKRFFVRVDCFKPEASRKDSKEFYIIANCKKFSDK